MSSVSVLIVTSDHEDCVENCLRSIFSCDIATELNVVVVDNDSRDGTLARINGHTGARVLRQSCRRSLSANLNFGLQKIDTAYALIVNPDIVLPAGAISQLRDFMEAHPEAGACGPKLVNPDGSLQLSCRRFPTPWTFFVRRTPIRYLLPLEMRGKKHLMTDCDHSRLQTVDWVLGACTMFRLAALREAGSFDERFPLYCEDIDVCHRLWGRGWAVYYHPDVVVQHDHQAKSDKRLLSRYALWHLHSMALYVWKHRLYGFRRPQIPREAVRGLGSDSCAAD